MSDQLQLPLSLPVNDVSFYRAGVWPDGAPAPSEVLPDAARLLRDLRAAAGRYRPSELVVTANRRVSVSYKLDRRARTYVLRAHWVVVSHADRVVDAVSHVTRTGSFPARFSAWLSELSGGVPDDGGYGKRDTGTALGTHVDLRAILREVAVLLPDPLIAADVTIEWGRRSPKRRKRRVLRLGSCEPTSGRIRIHPVLDDARIPEYVVAQVVFHELCHYVAPPLTVDVARKTRQHRIHHRRFRKLESRFPELDKANQWIDRHIDSLLAASS